MLNLVFKDLIQLKFQLLTLVGIMVLSPILLGRIAPTFLATTLLTYPIVYSLVIPQLLFQQEEHGNTFTFLRALPIHPASIVAAKYVLSTFTPLTAAVAIGLAQLSGALSTETALASLFGVVLICFILSALSLFVHFWLGTKKAKVALLVVAFSLSIPSFLIAGGQGEAFMELGNRIKPLATRPLGILVAFLVGLVVLGASLAGSAAIFTRRDLSNLP